MTLTITTEPATAMPSTHYVGDEIAESTRITFTILGIFYTLVGVLGNIFIIFTIFVTKTMRNPHYYFIVNLAIADLVITGYVIPHLVLSLILHYYPVVNFHHCVFNGLITVVAFVSSLLTLMAISINRYLSVCHNHLFQRIFSKGVISSIVGCVLIWLLAVLTTFPCLVGWGRFNFDSKTHYCGYDRTYNFSYTLFLMLFSIGTPVCVVFACNFGIWRFVRVSSHRIYALTHGKNKSEQPVPVSSASSVGSVYPQNSGDGDGEYEDDKTVCDGNADVVTTDSELPNKQDKLSREGQTTEQGENVDTSPMQQNSSDELQGHLKTQSLTTNNMNKKISDGRKKNKIVPGVKESEKKDYLTVRGHRRGSREILRESNLNKNKLTPRREDSIRQQQLTVQDQNTQDNKKVRSVLVTPGEIALIKTIFIIFLTFAVFMTPYMLSTLIDTTDQWYPVTHLVCSFTSFTNSCLNCVLYGLMTPAFKKAFKNVLPCFKHGKNQNHRRRGVPVAPKDSKRTGNAAPANQPKRKAEPNIRANSEPYPSVTGACSSQSTV